MASTVNIFLWTVIFTLSFCCSTIQCKEERFIVKTTGYKDVLKYNIDSLNRESQIFNSFDKTFRRTENFVELGQVNKETISSKFNKVLHAKTTAELNLNWFKHESSVSKTNGVFVPGQSASEFELQTIKGSLKYPSAQLQNVSILFHTYDPKSAFVQALWGDNTSLSAILENATAHSHYVFIPVYLGDSKDLPAKFVAQHLSARFKEVGAILQLQKRIDKDRTEDVMSRLHFVSQYTHDLGNWIPALFMEWYCEDHNCGYDQVVIKEASEGSQQFVSPRLDARYDWLPSPKTKFGNKQISAVLVGNGCKVNSTAKGVVAIITDGGCSYFQKVSAMQTSGATGVLVYANSSGDAVEDMHCEEKECSTVLSIPATMMPYYTFEDYTSANFTVQFQNTPSPAFFFAINPQGQLAELGWLLYPSFQFMVWQDQWFQYVQELNVNLTLPATIIKVLNTSAVMQGSKGATASVDIPADINQHAKVELDMALSCPGSRDEDCASWDHTVQLYVCCSNLSSLCGMELGRWITPFRRRIGRWLTDVTALTPLLSGKCNFTMKTAPWAEPWMPSLNLRISKNKVMKTYPYKILPLYNPGATFDKKYNSHWNTTTFTVPNSVTQVKVVSVITGHGSDENGCGEFCVTSHHFVVNNHIYNRTFSIAGTPLGCAEQVPFGVEPNEHGTWLYGRGGWCDGQEVKPWVIDVTSVVNKSGKNIISYYGWFQGKDPNPKQNPGEMILYSYVVFYRSD